MSVAISCQTFVSFNFKYEHDTHFQGPLISLTEIKCQPIDELFNGGSKCTSGSKVGSKCSFFCDCKNGYALYPSNSSDTQCILTEANTAVWDPVVPCCQREFSCLFPLL